MKSPFSRIPVVLMLALAVVALSACSTSGTGVSESSAPSRATASEDPAAASSPVRRELLEPRSGLYAEASRVGNMVWTAGHLPEGVPVTATVEAQVTRALDNLEQTLENAGAGFDTVVKANVYLTSFDDWEAFNTIFQLRLARAGGLPPRSVVAVSELGFGYRVEIEMVAIVRESSN